MVEIKSVLCKIPSIRQNFLPSGIPLSCQSFILNEAIDVGVALVTSNEAVTRLCSGQFPTHIYVVVLLETSTN